MKRGTPSHPKTTELAKMLGITRYAAVGIMEMLWHFAAQYAKRGDIGKWKNREIAEAVFWDGTPDDLVDALVLSGWLEESKEFRLLIHDWEQHADQTVRRSEEVQLWGFASRKLANASMHRHLAMDASQPEPEPETPTESPRLDRRDGAGRDDQKELWDGARDRANRLRAKLLKSRIDCTKQQDRSLLLKVCYLVECGRFPELFIVDAAEAVISTNPKKPWGYFQRCIANRAKESQMDLGRELAKVRIPEDLKHLLQPQGS